eukprot:snap_masked-scaffold_30-processed-gene-0.15-mRNA-1 protein AED:1.00 eAED:1.00 QI:0/-1/0/0/-1/1/1/0/100
MKLLQKSLKLCLLVLPFCFSEHQRSLEYFDETDLMGCKTTVCVHGWRCDPDLEFPHNCVPYTCDATDACNENEVCVDTPKKCSNSQVCPQFTCITPNLRN